MKKEIYDLFFVEIKIRAKKAEKRDRNELKALKKA
jgi:hypothetical protein